MRRRWESGASIHNRMEMLWVFTTVYNEGQRPFCGRRRPAFRRPQFEKHWACMFVRRLCLPKPGRFHDRMRRIPF